MSDTSRLQNVVLNALLNLLPNMQEDNRLTLTYMIVGLIMGRNVQFAKMAEEVNASVAETAEMIKAAE